MTFSHLGVTFHLGSPIKIFNPKTFVYRRKLQQLFIPELNSEPLLCLVETLKAYLDRVEAIRGNVDQLFVLFRDNATPASPQTISHWAKNILIKAGIKGYTVCSTRSASACGALLAGIPLDRILSQAGWIGNSSFMRNYIKPLSQTLPGSICCHRVEMDSLVQVKTNKVEKVVPHKYADSLGAVKNVTDPEVRVQKRGKAANITGRKIPEGKCPQQH